MELDLVDAVAEAVVRAQYGRVLVREAPPLERCAAEFGSERKDALVRPAGPLTVERLDERPVLRDEVVIAKRRRLIRDRDGNAASLRRAKETGRGLRETRSEVCGNVREVCGSSSGLEPSRRRTFD